MEIKNKMNDLNNNEDQPEEENNYMEDGELGNTEENQIQQQIEEDEKPAIMELRKEINGDKFIIDRNGKKIKLYDREEEEKKRRRKEEEKKKKRKKEDIYNYLLYLKLLKILVLLYI